MAIHAYRGVRPVLGDGAWVAPTATVLGDVVLGAGSSVWFQTVLRGDVFPIRVGARTNIQDGCVVHVTDGKASTTVGDDVTVGHMVLLHGCRVGSRVLVGMGSILLDGSVISDDCIVGAGSLVTPRTVVPPRTLVLGRPARVVRPLTDVDLEQIRSSAEHYVALARGYAEGALTSLG